MKNKKVEVVNDLLGFPGMKIIQRPDIFNFSLDSTLLASFVTINQKDKAIIDLGCGNAPIPLLLSMRTKNKIYGVEIQEEIASLARKNIELNNLTEQITILNKDAIGIHNELGVSKFDVVVSNPPYFIYDESSNINKNEYLTIARHEVKMNLESLLKETVALLKDGGTFAMVHRTSRLVDILTSFRKYSLEPKRIRFVYPKQDDDSLIVLIEAKKSKKVGNLKILPPLYVHTDSGEYTEEIKEIFNYNKAME